MSVKFFNLFVIIMIGYIIGAEARPSLRTFGSPKRSKNHNVEQRWIRQQVDNFDDNNHKTWDQRFFSNDEYYENGGPIFFMLRGEDGGSAGLMDSGSWIPWAEKYGAMLFQLEHRFYGKSFPTNDLSIDNLQYLTSKQALADAARFIKKMTDKYNFASDQQWILFGGSYAGALSVWMAQIYPDLVDGVVSSSGPLKLEVNFVQYLDAISQSLSNFSADCSKEIDSGFQALKEHSDTAEGRRKLYDLFELCHSVVNGSDKDISNLLYTVTGDFMNVVQYNTNSHDNGSPSIDKVCKVMTDESVGTSIERLAKVNKMVLKSQKSSCLAFVYDIQVRDLKKTSTNSPSVENGDRQWVYQTCNELGYFQTTDGHFQVFGNDFSLDFFTDQCIDVFGDKFDKHHIENNVSENNEHYGGLHPNVSNVLAVQGSADPWHTVGYTENITKGITSLFIEGTTHCADMYTPADTDPPQLTEARKQIEKFIGHLLNKN